jgi:tRNA G18 (ribose-2'-O)-methylase SpoU
MMERKVFLILYNIRSAYNVGAIFRTADAVGVTKIFLIGVTPCPVDRFGRMNSRIAKTALGAEKAVPWTYQKTITPVLSKLKKTNIKVVALEQAERSVDYRKIKLTGDWALVLGEETKGLPKSVLNRCDEVVEIPMRGKKESLNVSVAAGVALFGILGK